jgi:hypothetical protein
MNKKYIYICIDTKVASIDLTLWAMEYSSLSLSLFLHTNKPIFVEK